jgi:Domain of unknown function (DUF4404)
MTQQESLRELLARLHDRLGKADSVDPESRELLAEVMEDIERALGKKQRLESLAVQFEADHPGLAQTLRQLADVLGKAGI